MSVFENAQAGIIQIKQVSACRTYAGLLEGIPRKSYNEKMIEKVLLNLEKFHECSSLYLGASLINTEVLDIVKTHSDHMRELGMEDVNFEILPPIQCNALLSSSWNDDTKDESYYRGSNLAILWYQVPWPYLIKDPIEYFELRFIENPLEIIIEEDIQKKIRELDWKHIATKFSCNP